MYWYLKNNNNKTPAVGTCTGKIMNKFNCHHGLLSLEGAATSVIYVMTKVLSQQTCVCHDKHMLVMTNVLCLSQALCSGKSMLVAMFCYDTCACCDKYLSRQTKFCHDKHTFGMTKYVFCHDKHVCCDKNYTCGSSCP